jgi:hypothetical protein
LGLYGYDPDTMINQTGFVLEVNGEELDTFITGADPYFSFLWTPERPGDYNIRVRGSSIDGTEAFTQNLDVEVFNDSENSVKILTNFTLDRIDHILGNTSLLPFEIESKFGAVEEIRVFDNGVEVGSYPSQGMDNLSYQPGNGFFNFAWIPNYVGSHEILVSVKLQNGVYVFSEAHLFEVVQGVNIIISPDSEALNTKPFSFLLHEQCTKVGVEVELDRGEKPKLSQAFLYGNDVFLSQKIFEDDLDYIYNTKGVLTGNIAWNFDWNVSYRDFVDLPLDNENTAEIDLKVILVTQEDMSMGLKSQKLISNSVPIRIRSLSIDDPISAYGLFYYSMTGDRLCDLSALGITPDENGTTNEDVVRAVAKYTTSDEETDLYGAYRVLTGQDFPDRIIYKSELDLYRQVYDSNLTSYIIGKLISEDSSSNNYGKLFDDRDHFLGTREGDFYNNRIDFVNHFYRNKYGNLPTTIQSQTGASKMWYARNLGEVGVAANFIFNLVREPTTPATFGSAYTYLPNMASHRDRYREQVEIFKLSEQNQAQDIDKAIADFLVDQQALYNFLWADARTSEVSENWKESDWFGWFSDENFPWIYSIDLGWLYSQSNSPNNVWFYSETIGWFWTTQNIYKDYVGLTEYQRYLFRVRPKSMGGWEGSWSLVTLPAPGSGLTEILFYDYGYVPLL